MKKKSELIFYRTPDGVRNVEVVIHKNDMWLSQKSMSDLFDVKIPAISKHLKNIFDTGELLEDSVVSILEITAEDGKIYKTKHYSLDAVIAVGYRVNSYNATQFRIWATKSLKEFMTKGFLLDDERLKRGPYFGQDNFEELLERIREIRASERRLYQKITDIYALSADYDSKAPVTKTFFASVQNKLHWAITGKTSAEIVHSSADASKPLMGLKSYKNSPSGKVLKSDVSVAKNYLEKEHIGELNRLVSAYLDLAENRARRRHRMNMSDWTEFLDRFLELSDYEVLQHRGKISAEAAKIKAHSEYIDFRVIQDRDYISDFDRQVRKLGNDDE